MLITIDTGGTKTLMTTFTRSGKPGKEHRFATPKNESDYIGTLTEIIYENYVSKGHTIDAVTIGIPGIVRDNKAVFCPNLGWKNFDIAKKLSSLVEAPIWLENDANLAGLSEVLRLEKPPRNGLYVTISTGIGTGVIAGGKIDPNMSLSEGGHMLIEYDGRLREWESFASGKSIRETYGMYARDITSRHIWKQIADKISRGFLTMLPMIVPDVVIIGGSMGSFFPQYSTYLKKYLKDQLPEELPFPQIRQARYPEEAVVYGCYYYGVQKLAETANG